MKNLRTMFGISVSILTASNGNVLTWRGEEKSKITTDYSEGNNLPEVVLWCIEEIQLIESWERRYEHA